MPTQMMLTRSSTLLRTTARLRFYSTPTGGSINNPAARPVAKQTVSKPPSPVKVVSNRAERINNKSIWQSYKGLPYRTKLTLSVACTIFASLGLLVADKLEDVFPAQPSRPVLKAMSTNQDGTIQDTYLETVPSKPKLFSISVVDKKQD